MGDTGLTLLCDISMDQQWPVVPAKWHRPVFDVIHNLSHSGVNTTCKLVSAKYVWHELHNQSKTGLATAWTASMPKYTGTRGPHCPPLRCRPDALTTST